jgi:hypothetical protein
VISYCVACYRPVYARQLIDELIHKTSVPYEILLWINLADPDFDVFLQDRIESGAPLRIVGRSPDNIGMAAYPRLFEQSRFDMVTQIDDDVVCIAPQIAQTARAAFDRYPQVGMLTADVWQDEYTTGARPPMAHYRVFDKQLGLHDGPVDGWFAVYRKQSLTVCRSLRPGKYYLLGSAIRGRLRQKREFGLLCTRMKVFHVTGPAYVSCFGMLDSEIGKYQSVGRTDMVNWYSGERQQLPPADELIRRVEKIREHLAHWPAAAECAA